jgi:hypothetical protein
MLFHQAFILVMSDVATCVHNCRLKLEGSLIFFEYSVDEVRAPLGCGLCCGLACGVH